MKKYFFIKQSQLELEFQENLNKVAAEKNVGYKDKYMYGNKIRLIRLDR